MAEKPRPFRPSLVVALSFVILVLLILASLVLVVGWSLGWNVRGIEVWTHVLTGSFTFLIGILLGANAPR